MKTQESGNLRKGGKVLAEKLIDKKISYGFYCELKSNGIYTNTFYSKGYVYRFRPTVYTVR